MTKRKPFNFDEWDRLAGHAQNRALCEWLSNDDDRRALFQRVGKERHLKFPSRSTLDDDPTPRLDDSPRRGNHDVYLLACEEDVLAVLGSHDFSVRVYRALGSGRFMLGMEPEPAHAAQREIAEGWLDAIVNDIDALALEAIAQAAVVALATRRFDLAVFAELVGLRFSLMLFGYADTDASLVHEAATKSYRALTYQLIGRHFAAEPDTVPASQSAMARLIRRTDELLSEYDRVRRYPDDPPIAHQATRRPSDWPEGINVPATLGSKFKPLLKSMSQHQGELSGNELAIVAAGLVIGTIGNIQASVCIAVADLLPPAADGLPRPGEPDLRELIHRALVKDPPVAFLSRQVKNDRHPLSKRIPDLKKDDEVILCMGAVTPTVSTLVFGEPGAHACLGRHLAFPLVVATVRHVLSLPGLAHRLDPATLEPIGLKKRWGFACESFPLTYRRDRRIVQQPLQVIMRIRSPVPENAARLRDVIRFGAPRIAQVLRDSRHVHFAWFQLIDGDTRLALQTVFDGDFDDYVLHFALVVDDVFDSLFRFVEDAPPLPVRKHPEAFVEAIRRFHRPPLEGFFFSAYPKVAVPNVERVAREPRHP